MQGQSIVLLLQWKNEAHTPIDVEINGQTLATIAFNDSDFQEDRLLIAKQPTGKFDLSPLEIIFRHSGEMDESAASEAFLTITGMALCTPDEKDLAAARLCDELSVISKELARKMFNILVKRPDLQKLAFKSPHAPAIGLILWILQHGLHEYPELDSLKSNLYALLADRDQTPLEDLPVHGYTQLINDIYLNREDLHIFDASTIEGRNSLVKWFDTYGAKEYGISSARSVH